jgi:hypothetical protein
LGVATLILLFNIVIPIAGLSQQGTLAVTSAVICKNVAERAAIGEGSDFSSTVGKLFCLTRLENIESATKIFHVWYFGDIERARVELNINPPAWRTYSSKIIQPHETGAWRVEILNGSGDLLKTVQFEINP